MRPSEAAALARQALADGDSTLARSVAERLLAEFANYPPARLVRALLAEQANDTDAALDDLRAVASAEPTNAEARAVQARLFQRRGDTDRARMAARQAVELIPSDPEVLESALEILNLPGRLAGHERCGPGTRASQLRLAGPGGAPRPRSRE